VLVCLTVWPAAAIHAAPAAPADGASVPELIDRLLLHTQDETVACVSDGSEGKRIVAVYLHPSDQSDDYAVHTEDIDRTLSRVDDVWDGAADPFDQHPRWACTPDTERPVILDSTGPGVEEGAYTFAEVQDTLRHAGLADPNRVYLVFADHIGAFPYFGQATVDADDRPGPANLNDTGPAYAMVDAEATGWSYSSMWETALHELGHALGAVQCSAPHSSCPAGETGKNHCWDETDVMCYDDGGSYFRGPDGVRGTDDDRTTTVVCPNYSSEAEQWDCNKDDYFNPSPGAGSYLATHWNIAYSDFVTPLQGE